jgi:hypothetical protein
MLVLFHQNTPTLFWWAGVPPSCNMFIQSIKDFCKSKGFVEINKTVRVNQKGYPFITFMTAENKAENVYFSRTKASEVSEGMVISAELFSKLRVAETINADGEPRVKLCGSGESQRVSISDLL